MRSGSKGDQRWLVFVPQLTWTCNLHFPSPLRWSPQKIQCFSFYLSRLTKGKRILYLLFFPFFPFFPFFLFFFFFFFFFFLFCFVLNREKVLQGDEEKGGEGGREGGRKGGRGNTGETGKERC